MQSTAKFFVPPLELWEKLATMALLARSVVQSESVAKAKIDEIEAMLSDPFLNEWLEWAAKNRPYNTSKIKPT